MNLLHRLVGVSIFICIPFLLFDHNFFLPLLCCLLALLHIIRKYSAQQVLKEREQKEKWLKLLQSKDHRENLLILGILGTSILMIFPFWFIFTKSVPLTSWIFLVVAVQAALPLYFEGDEKFCYLTNKGVFIGVNTKENILWNDITHFQIEENTGKINLNRKNGKIFILYLDQKDWVQKREDALFFLKNKSYLFKSLAIAFFTFPAFGFVTM